MVGGLFSGTLFIWRKPFRERPPPFTQLARPRKQSLSLAAQFEAKFSSVERIQPAAGTACPDHSTLPKPQRSSEVSEVQASLQRALNPLKSLREIFNILLLHKGPKMRLVF